MDKLGGGIEGSILQNQLCLLLLLCFEQVW